MFFFLFLISNYNWYKENQQWMIFFSWPVSGVTWLMWSALKWTKNWYSSPDKSPLRPKLNLWMIESCEWIKILRLYLLMKLWRLHMARIQCMLRWTLLKRRPIMSIWNLACKIPKHLSIALLLADKILFEGYDEAWSQKINLLKLLSYFVIPCMGYLVSKYVLSCNITHIKYNHTFEEMH